MTNEILSKLKEIGYKIFFVSDWGTDFGFIKQDAIN